MKAKWRWWYVVVVVVVAVLADAGWARHREQQLRDTVSAGLSPIEAFADRVAVGMPRSAVEAMIRGYRQYSIFEADGEQTVTYLYWWGFIPPLRAFTYKTVGSVQVTYSAEGRVVSKKHWVR